MTPALMALPCKAQNTIVCDGQQFPSISSILSTLPPNSSTTVDARNAGCSTIVQGVTLASGAGIKLLLGRNGYQFLGSITFSGSFEVEGQGYSTAILVPPPGVGAAFVAGAPPPYLVLRNLTVNGNSVKQIAGHYIGSQLLNLLSGQNLNVNAPVVLDSLLIQCFIAECNSIQGQPKAPSIETPIINLAANTAFTVKFSHSYSTDNQQTTVFNGGNILHMDDDWVNSPDSSPGIQSQGQVIVTGGDYQALTPNADGSAPDFLIEPIGNQAIEVASFQYVRFGPEQESATHVRIKVSGTPSTNILYGLTIEDCSFGVLGSSVNVNQPTAPIEFDTPVSNATISGNIFLYYPTFINDAYPPIFQSQDNVFTKTNFMAQGQGNFKGICVNGCVGFSNVENPGVVTLGNLQSWQSTNWSHEQNSVGNFILNSETYSSWATANVTITPGQADPYGTNRAALLAGGGGNANEEVILSFQPPGGVSTIFFSIWAKGGTASLMSVNLFRSLNQLNPVSAHAFALTNAWQQYYAVYTWDPSATSGNVVIFISNPQTPQTIYVFAPEATSGQPSDYVPTGASPVSNASVGLRFERSLLFGPSSSLVSPALTTPTVNENNPAVFYAPTTVTLGADVSLNANVATSIVSSSITMPGAGGPFRILTDYAMYWNAPQQVGMRCTAWVTDGNNGWATSENRDPSSSGQSGNNGFGLSPVIYPGGAKVTLALEVLCDQAGTITVAPPQQGPPSTYFQSAVVAAN
jgi:hypothetical protein